jgi:hypothetical protein
MSLGTLLIFGCRPKNQEEVVSLDNNAKLRTLPKNYSPSPQLGGKINPYSMKNIREVRELFGYLSIAPEEEVGKVTNEEKETLHNLATMPLDESQKKLYVMWQPSGSQQIKAFANALKLDSTIQIFSHPLDSTTYKAQNYKGEEDGQQYLESFKQAGNKLQ